ncbi:MAG TPA: DUF4360 domain-containing protein [Oligoflexus sp.]|uniref:DUF4360 domain-containing protein n=1 Tax=Oligoflexus sp. TaxID=1971216 RepID=UPI002D64536D|nr:DUF4360 domain-containing protein [Oligoflexus sp.]HYX39017.1 DUF4360 domain-containing protein [Oligoflexus sp.]
MRMPLIAIGSCLLSLTAPMQGEELVPSYVGITMVSVNGSGCPKDSVQTNIAKDRLSFSLNFWDYLAEVKPGSTPSSQRKFCQISVDLDVPTGWRFAVAGFDYRGYIKLDEGIEAAHNTEYYIQGTGMQGNSVTNSKKGPQDNAFFYQQQVKIADQVWSSCEKQRTMQIKLKMQVTNTDPNRFPNAEGTIGTDSVEGSFQKWKLSWSRCP